MGNHGRGFGLSREETRRCEKGGGDADSRIKGDPVAGDERHHLSSIVIIGDNRHHLSSIVIIAEDRLSLS